MRAAALLAPWAARASGSSVGAALAPPGLPGNWYAGLSPFSTGILYNYSHYPGKNAYSQGGGVELDNNTDAPIHLSVFECLDHCQLKLRCDCVVFKPINGECWAYRDCDPEAFIVDPLFDVYVRHHAVAPTLPATTTLTTSTSTLTSTTTSTGSATVKRIADGITLATIAAVMLAGMGIYVKVGRLAYVAQPSKTGLLLTLGLFHCVGQFIPWVALCFDGVDCQRGMDWTVHLFYAVLLALASPFLGGVYISSVARDRLPLLGWRGLPFLIFSYGTTVTNGIDTYSDSLITAKAMDCAHEVEGLEVLAPALMFNFWAGMAAQVLTMALVGRLAANGSPWRGFKWALLALADVLPHPHARDRLPSLNSTCGNGSAVVHPETPSQAGAVSLLAAAQLTIPRSPKASLDGREDDPRSLKSVSFLERDEEADVNASFSLGVDADAKVFAQTLILVRLVTEDLPQPILQFLLGQRVGFGYDVCLSMVSGVLLSMYGIFELIAEGHGDAGAGSSASSAGGGSSSAESSGEDETSDSDATEDGGDPPTCKAPPPS